MVVIVPIPITNTAPSPQAHELADKITQLVSICREDDPTIEAEDVDVALQLARKELRGTTNNATTVAIGLILLGIFVTGLVVYFNNMTNPQPYIGIAVVAGLGIVLAFVAVLRRQRGA